MTKFDLIIGYLKLVTKFSLQNLISKCRHSNFFPFRRLPEWGPWSQILEIDTSSEFKEVKKRECSMQRNDCPGESTVVLQWYVFIHEKQYWAGARESCEEMGATLFWKLDGTREQLDFFYQKVFDQPFWLGITMKEYGVFQNLLGEDIPIRTFRWDKYEPTRSSLESVIVAWHENGERKYIHNCRPTSVSAAAVCDFNS